MTFLGYNFNKNLCYDLSNDNRLGEVEKCVTYPFFKTIYGKNEMREASPNDLDFGICYQGHDLNDLEKDLTIGCC